jgi:ornithine carrier protein
MDLKENPVLTGESGSRLSASYMVEKETAALDHTQGTEALKDVICGSVAGVVGKYIEYPFDTIKVRLQSQPNHLPLKYTGPIDCFKKSLKQDGFTGIYRGISAPLVGAAVETSCLFFSVSSSWLQPELWLMHRTVPSGWRRAQNFWILSGAQRPS